jgi:hypothetical protein
VERCGLDSSGSGNRPAAAVVNAVMNLRVPCKVGNLTGSVAISFSRWTLLHGVS